MYPAVCNATPCALHLGNAHDIAVIETSDTLMKNTRTASYIKARSDLHAPSLTAAHPYSDKTADAPAREIVPRRGVKLRTSAAVKTNCGDTAQLDESVCHVVKIKRTGAVAGGAALGGEEHVTSVGFNTVCGPTSVGGRGVVTAHRGFTCGVVFTVFYEIVDVIDNAVAMTSCVARSKRYN